MISLVAERVIINFREQVKLVREQVKLVREQVKLLSSLESVCKNRGKIFLGPAALPPPTVATKSPTLAKHTP